MFVLEVFRYAFFLLTRGEYPLPRPQVLKVAESSVEELLRQIGVHTSCSLFLWGTLARLFASLDL